MRREDEVWRTAIAELAVPSDRADIVSGRQIEDTQAHLGWCCRVSAMVGQGYWCSTEGHLAQG